MTECVGPRPTLRQVEVTLRFADAWDWVDWDRLVAPRLTAVLALRRRPARWWYWHVRPRLGR